LELIRELSRDDKMMWVVGGGEVVSENNAKGIKPPELSKGYLTIEADNWHFHLKLEAVDGVQFVAGEPRRYEVLLRALLQRLGGDAGPLLLPQPVLGRPPQAHAPAEGAAAGLPGHAGELEFK
jgi:hypothetical protein